MKKEKMGLGPIPLNFEIDLNYHLDTKTIIKDLDFPIYLLQLLEPNLGVSPS